MIKNTFLIVIVLLISIIPTFSQPTPPTNGDGTINNPYEIVTLEDLYWVFCSDTVWNKYFIQTADIDALQTAAWDNFRPIGNEDNKFTGTYNGKGHVIHRLTINRTSDYVGLFGYTSMATIDSLGLTNVDITGGDYTGGLVGKSTTYTSISSCYTTGVVKGKQEVGGLIGTVDNHSTISLSYSNCNVTSVSRENGIGGFVGDVFSYSVINICFSTGEVKGASSVGGFAGRNGFYSEISNCYSSGMVSRYSTDPNSDNFGGFVGTNYGTAIINNCYSSANQTHQGGNSGGFVGQESGTENNSFFDYSVTECTDAHGVNSKSTAEMQEMCLYVDGTLASWDFIGEDINGTDDIWGININENGGYPFLKFQGFTHTGICCSVYDPVPPEVPTLSDISGECSVTITNLPTTIDNCGTITGTTTDQLTYSTLGTHTVTWTFTDDGGNSVNATQNVIVTEDETNPTITCASNQTVSANQFHVYVVNGTEFDPISINDNCTVANITNDLNNSSSLTNQLLDEGMNVINWTIVDGNNNEATCSTVIIVDTYTGINDIDNNNISIYPNPTSNFIQIENLQTEANTIDILDITGEIVKTVSSNSKNIKIDVSTLEKGVYIVKVGETVTRFVKK